MALSDIEMNEMGADCRDSGFCVSRYHAILLSTSKHYGDLVNYFERREASVPGNIQTKYFRVEKRTLSFMAEYGYSILPE